MRVAAEGVTFFYDRRRLLLDDTSVEIGSGEVVAVLGPSGSGKSTLLYLFGGLLSPATGTISWDGQTPDYRRADRLTWVLQTVNAVGQRSALDNVMLGLYARGVPWPQARPTSVAMLEKVGLGHCVERRANDLSGGELQRMVIARALVGAPSLVLADEPTGQLDGENSRVAIDCLVEARPESTTVVIATHDPLVASSSHRVLRLESGKILETGQ